MRGSIVVAAAASCAAAAAAAAAGLIEKKICCGFAGQATAVEGLDGHTLPLALIVNSDDAA